MQVRDAEHIADEHRIDRARVDGRVAFAVGAFVAACGLIALLDRVGAPERLVQALGALCALTGFAIVGLALRTMRISRFYAAGRGAPAAYAGLAMAGLWFGLILPYAPPAPNGFSSEGVAPGLFAGLCVAGLCVGPLLRKAGAFSMADLLSARFPGVSLRLAAATLISAVCLMTAVGGFEIALQAFVAATGLTRAVGAALMGAALFLALAPGGAAAGLWVAAGAAAIGLCGMAMPLALLAFSDQAYVAPGVDREAYRAALQQIAAWRGVDPPVDAWMAALAAALGAATLAPLLGPAIAVVNARASLRGGAAAIGGALGLGALALAVMATGALALLDSGAGRQPGAMAPALYAESAAKRLAVCGAYVSAPQEAESACRARTGAEGAALRPGDLAPRGLFLLTAPPLLAELGPAQTGLLWTAVMGFGFAIAAAALLGLATALGHDGVYRVRDASALTSRRLAITRLCLVCAIAALAYGLSQFAIDPALAMGLALAISAAGVAPVLLLAFVPIAAAPQAVLAALAGGAACAGSIVFGGLSLHFLTYAALNGAVIGFGAGLVASLLPIGDKSEARRLRAALVSRAGPIVAMDKGA